MILPLNGLSESCACCCIGGLEIPPTYKLSLAQSAIDASVLRVTIRQERYWYVQRIGNGCLVCRPIEDGSTKTQSPFTVRPSSCWRGQKMSIWEKLMCIWSHDWIWLRSTSEIDRLGECQRCGIRAMVSPDGIYTAL